MYNESAKKEIKEINFSQAAVIDENGKEVAITEDMLQSAFEKLMDSSMLPASLLKSTDL